MIVKVLKIPVRYQGVTYPAGQVFEMGEEYYNKKLVEEVEDKDMTKYSKAADRGVVVQPAQEPAIDYSKLSEAELKKIKNDDLTAYLDAKGIEYKSDAIKEDYINAILGK